MEPFPGKVSSHLPLLADHFERLPDSVLLLIFNKVQDIKSLGLCLSVSKRFFSLIPMVEDILIKVDCVITDDEDPINSRTRGFLSHLLKMVMGSFVKSLEAFHKLVTPQKIRVSEVTHHSPVEVLKSFSSIRTLKIQLPNGELGFGDGVLLKWRAEFGTSLESCVILGASSVIEPGFVREKTRVSDDLDMAFYGEDESGTIPESFYINGGLKLRVVWTISSLIAASARHFVLQQIISEHPGLERLTVTDCDNQGILSMNSGQLSEIRVKPISASASANRTQVPALSMKLWYAPYIELPNGMGFKGATLVFIRPSDRPMGKEEADQFVSMAFDGAYGEVARLLVKRKTYILEMNSF
ncbi:hypothetical protein AMTRI_Chr07g25290 [Amborella trichopoda]|uniref:F-box domain-containing protein n=1 Tax=Amborella trichopoda TaxID=13333 RepID=U5D0H0_AMBTC|nr:F-box protein At5g46170 [Amborella trichopoda]ERN15924.1 hypothetical protein AMTR_s00039p00227540 [Amborella trichopoda]|eukprot:XP_006854457.1 F-box protein At5g46170 [Amborella trichopoda]